MTEPTKLQKIFRCSACAKSILYGIIIFVTLASLFIWWGVNGFETNVHLSFLSITLGGAIALITVIIIGAKICFNRYCDLDSDDYDDKFALGIAFFLSFIAFIITVYVIANAEWFIEIFERGMRTW